MAEGSIYKVGKAYRGKLMVKGANGRPKPKMFRGPTRRAVRKKMNTWLESGDLNIAEPTMTVSQMCRMGIVRAENKRRAENTVRGYKGFLKDHIDNDRYGVGDMKVVALRSHHVENMMEGMEASRQTKLLVRAFLRYCVNKIALKAGIVDRNEAALADPPERGENERTDGNPRLTPQALELILENEPNPVRRCAYLVIATTGLRIEECLTLTWHNFTEQPDGIWVQVDKSKTPKGLEPVPVPGATWEALQALGKSSIYALPSKTGRPISYRNFVRSWTAALERAELPYTNVYKLRHLFGSMKARHVSDAILARLMRHTDPRTSKQYYVEPFPEELREAVEKN